MTLVDTSVWVDHLRYGSSTLAELLDAAQVLSHPFVIGELALGQLRQRSQVLGLLRRLPAAPHADHQEVMSLVERQGLAGSGIGWVDAHLLASARLARVRLWTFDRSLDTAASAMDLAWRS